MILLACVVMCIAVTGYFIGVTAPMGSIDEFAREEVAPILPNEHSPTDTGPVIPSTSYASFFAAQLGSNQGWKTELSSLKQLPNNPYAKPEITAEYKHAALAEREKLRAYNGAPPTVPHPIDQLSSKSCMSCHEQGLRSRSITAARMPHPYLASCTQCHAEDRAKFAAATVSFANTFSGLPAPFEGPRAFPGAPPLIPHSTWMRNDCLSCHGHTGKLGLRTTHAWRTNCQQCHAPSASLNQVKLAESPMFLPPPEIEQQP